MKLKDWRKKENKNQDKVAEDLKVDQSSVCCWEQGKKLPDKENMQKIVAYTNGEVQPNDFYEVEQ